MSDREKPRRADRERTTPHQQKKRKPGLDVDAILARADDPATNLLAEIEAEIEGRAQEVRPKLRGEQAPTAAAREGHPDLTDLGTLRAMLRRHGIHPNKGFGQHLLVDRHALDTIVEAADLRPDDSALEVGSGTGVLTVELAQRARRVVAVELDSAILPVLRETTRRFDNVEIIPRDLLDVQPEIVFGDAPYKLVANLPYYITALTLRHFLEAANPPRAMIVMVQWEVAQRMAAAPGDMSLLGLSVQFYGAPRILARVPASSFFPPPQVDSAIVRVDLYPQPLLTGAARDRFFGIAHAGFAEKRKQLHNSLARNLHLPQETISSWLAAAQIDPVRRAETLSIDEWLRLTQLAMEQPT
ncbi:MAG: 16S rRNA (adenine(1518)-N(6)/adenine(1519)-N(6))-dimethyltransferase RsmA [Ktedonobacterales bacterium]